MITRFIDNELQVLRQVMCDSKDLIKYYQNCIDNIDVDAFIDWAKNVYQIDDNYYQERNIIQETIFNALSANILYMTIFSITFRPVEKLKHLIGLSLLHKLSEPIKIYLKADFYKEDVIYGISELFYIYQSKQIICLDIASDIGVIQNNFSKQLGKLRCKQIQQDVYKFSENDHEDNSYSLILRFYDRQIDMSVFSNLIITTLIIIDLSQFDISQLKLNYVQQLLFRNVSWTTNSSPQLQNLEKLSLDVIDGITSQDFIYFKSLTHLSLSSIHNIQDVLTHIVDDQILYISLWNIQLSDNIQVVNKFLNCKDFIIKSCQIEKIILKNCLQNVQNLIIDCGKNQNEQEKINVRFINISFFHSIKFLHLPDKTYDDINLNLCSNLESVHALQINPSLLSRKSYKQYINLQSKILSIHTFQLNSVELQSLIMSINILHKRQQTYIFRKIKNTRFNNVLLKVDQL